MNSLAQSCLDRILESVWSNCNDPVDGVRRQAIELFERLLSLAAQSRCSAFIATVTTSVLAKDWRLKGRYVLLAALCKQLDVTCLFQEHPELQSDLFRGIGVSMLDQVAFDVYAASLDRVKALTVGNDLIVSWADTWQDSFATALTAGVPAVMHQLSTYWFRSHVEAVQRLFTFHRLPYTFKSVPAAFRCLFDELRDVAPTAALIAMLEAARGSGIASRDAASEILFLPIVRRAVCHRDEAVAIAGLQFITAFDRDFRCHFALTLFSVAATSSQSRCQMWRPTL